MKAIFKPRNIAWLLGLGLIAGCASPLGSNSVDAATYEAMTCADLNVAMSEAATSISKAAISRGNIGKVNIPVWVPGGTKAVSVLKDRRSAQIERLRTQQAAIEAVRSRRCP